MRLKALVLAACAAVIVLAAQEEVRDLRARSVAALAQASGDLDVSGLEQPVEVIRDRWGVPHIYAKTVHDLFFAQGFVAAQDRLWQLDVWRRIATGELAEVLGPAGVTRDTFARLLRYRGDMDAEWTSYRADAKAIVEAFVSGINAQIALVTSQPGKLPIEFQLAGVRPEPWTPEVVIGRMAGYIMTRNARTEVQRARLARAAGVGALAEQVALDPPTSIPLPDGLDLDDITDDILALTAGAGESADFSPLKGRLEKSTEPRAMSNEDGRTSAWAFARPALVEPPPALRGDGYVPPDPDAIGSNDWVLSGKLTATGRPILANDPHRSILLPSLRYTVHLNGPGWNVIGAGEPALPGVAAGHNDRIAFGFTIVGIDQQDLYVERLDPANPERYVYQGRSEPMRSERETIEVRGEGPREIVLRFTRHGPVLHRDLARGRAYALRWVGSEPGAAGYLKALALDTARDWPGFLQALEGWKVPSENIVYADVDGNIGWVAAGAAPIRPNWNGLLPVPGHEGKYEWQGFLKVADLPQLFNPSSGFVATANHNILPAGYDKVLGFEFSNAYRFTRILEVLEQARGEGRKLTVGDSERLQHDELSVVARALRDALRVAVLRAGRPDGDAGRAAAMLVDWDARLSRDSAAAALFEIWQPLLSAAARSAMATAGLEGGGGRGRVSTDRLLGWLAAAGLLPGPTVAANWVDGSPRPRVEPVSDPAWRDQAARVLVAALTGPALADAWREAGSRMGADPARWAWGAIHHAALRHPLAFTPARQQVFDLAEVPRGGDGTTPNATGSGARQTSGASYREVIDLADWDRSTTINVPGISGQPGSPHYGDLLPLWAEGRYHPMVFSRGAVEKVAGATLHLRPAQRPGGRR